MEMPKREKLFYNSLKMAKKKQFFGLKVVMTRKFANGFQSEK
jgi:hypothetical protein